MMSIVEGKHFYKLPLRPLKNEVKNLPNPHHSSPNQDKLVSQTQYFDFNIPGTK